MKNEIVDTVYCPRQFDEYPILTTKSGKMYLVRFGGCLLIENEINFSLYTECVPEVKGLKILRVLSDDESNFIYFDNGAELHYTYTFIDGQSGELEMGFLYFPERVERTPEELAEFESLTFETGIE